MLIGISGKIGSGKNTVANLIMDTTDNKYAWQDKAFAGKLKQITSIMTGVSIEDCYSQEGKNIFLKEWQMTVGEFQQKLGTDAVRMNLHQNAWVITLFADYNPGYSNWIITDVRFTNEAKAIKKRDGLLIRVEGDPAGIAANSGRDLNHASETGLDSWSPWDFMIDNTGTIDELNEQVKEFVERYL